MTVAEKIEMYKGKKVFIDNVSKAFEVKPRASSVDSIEYKVYRHPLQHRDYFIEYLVVNFFGGSKSVRCITGNSNIANFKVISSLIEGGYYNEVRDYETLSDLGYELVALEN